MLLLKILEKLGRMKVVMDRGPSHKDYHLAKPWTKRYYLLFRYRPRWFPFNILINHILDNDHGVGLHNHPFPFITIIIKGGYWETNNQGEKTWRKKGYIFPAFLMHEVHPFRGEGERRCFSFNAFVDA